jgi:hypothetical protein
MEEAAVLIDALIRTDTGSSPKDGKGAASDSDPGHDHRDRDRPAQHRRRSGVGDARTHQDPDRTDDPEPQSRQQVDLPVGEEPDRAEDRYRDRGELTDADGRQSWNAQEQERRNEENRASRAGQC